MTDEQAPAKESLWDKIKGWFTKAKESETAEKVGEMADKAWDKTKDASGKAWDKTKDVAEDVKEWGEEKIDDIRDKDGDKDEDEGDGEGEGEEKSE